MSIEERLDAITMNLELQIRETEALRDAQHEARLRQMQEAEALREVQIREREDRIRAENSLREDLRSLAESTTNLVIAAQNHERRLNGLEGRN